MTAIVVAGGGVVGLTLALALTGIHRFRGEVVLVDTAAAGEQQASGADRPIALSRSSAKLYHALGLWQEIGQSATPIVTIDVSQQGYIGSTLLDARREGIDAFGWVVGHDRLLSLLRSALRALPDGVEWLERSRVASFDGGESVVGCQIEPLLGGEIGYREARLLVAVDGGASQLREQIAGQHCEVVDYHQHAVTARVELASPHRNRAWERFVGTGPMALLPQGGCAAGLVWSVASERVDEVLSLDQARFLQALNEGLGRRGVRVADVGERSTFPLARVIAGRPSARRMVLLGNAAHTLHPVAGQGLNLALRDLAALVDAIAWGGDPGDSARLQAWVGQRKSDQQRTALVSDGLVRLFGNRSPLLGHLRGAGLLALDLVPMLGSRLTRWGMGMTPPLPGLTCGIPLSTCPDNHG